MWHCHITGDLLRSTERFIYLTRCLLLRYCIMPCRARGKTHTVQIWADAVCIDQASIAERNSQVLMTDEIYANAILVLVDLGSG